MFPYEDKENCVRGIRKFRPQPVGNTQRFRILKQIVHRAERTKYNENQMCGEKSDSFLEPSVTEPARFECSEDESSEWSLRAKIQDSGVNRADSLPLEAQKYREDRRYLIETVKIRQEHLSRFGMGLR